MTAWFYFLHVLAALWLAAGVFAGAVVRAQTRSDHPGLDAHISGAGIGLDHNLGVSRANGTRCQPEVSHHARAADQSGTGGQYAGTAVLP